MWFGEPHRLPEEFLLPDWALRDKQGTKGDRVDVPGVTTLQQRGHSHKKQIRRPKWHKTNWEYSEARRSQVAALDVFLPIY